MYADGEKMTDDPKEIKNVALYMRVSTEEQATHGFSIDSQLDRLRSYAHARDWTISGEYIDGGYTGRNTNRPAYQKMFDEIDNWDGVLVVKMDRIHRSQKNFIAMMENLRQHDRDFISMNESFDTSTAMGRFVMGIMSGVAQLESEQTGERIQAAFIQKAKSDIAGHMSHRVPFGYLWDKENQKHIEVPEELDLVRMCFDLYLKGESFREIARDTGLSNTNVRYYLHNSFYAGVERWCNFFRESSLTPTVTIEQFNDVQKLMVERCRTHKKYDPMIIRNGSYTIDKDTQKNIPQIQRAKHPWKKGF